jgi:hypothetical protein
MSLSTQEKTIMLGILHFSYTSPGNKNLVSFKDMQQLFRSVYGNDTSDSDIIKKLRASRYDNGSIQWPTHNETTDTSTKDMRNIAYPTDRALGIT